MWKCLPCRQTPQLYQPPGTLFSPQISCFSPVLTEERHILAVFRVGRKRFGVFRQKPNIGDAEGCVTKRLLGGLNRDVHGG